MHISKWLLLLSLICSAFGQVPEIRQDSKGACSNVVALTGNVTINCSALTPAQKKIIDGLPALLRKILDSQVDVELLLRRLDEIHHDVKQTQEMAQTQKPWRLTGPEKAILTEHLGRHLAEVKIWQSMSVPNAAYFAESIGQALKEIGWKSEWGNGEMTAPTRGIVITVGTAEFPAAAALQRALRAMGLKAEGNLSPGMAPGLIELHIGDK